MKPPSTSPALALPEASMPLGDAVPAASVADAALVVALRAGGTVARAELFDRYGAHVQRVLAHVLGTDAELSDLVHEVFARALSGIHTLRDGERLKPWLTGIAIHAARSCLRARSRRRWLRFLAPEALPEPVAPEPTPEVQEAVRCTYAVLDQLAADERIAFTLRYIDGMELLEVARACRVSLATVKRRLARAERRFRLLAGRHPALQSWLEGGSRWGGP